MVCEESEEGAQESDHESFPDFGDDAHDFLESDITCSVNACDGVNHRGGGEEREDQEEGEVDELEQKEDCQFGGNKVGEFVVCLGAYRGFVQLDFVADDLGDEEVGDFDLGQEDEGEWEDQSQGDLAEDLSP